MWGYVRYVYLTPRGLSKTVCGKSWHDGSPQSWIAFDVAGAASDVERPPHHEAPWACVAFLY